MTEPTAVVLTGQEMFNIRQTALQFAMNLSIGDTDGRHIAKVLVDASACLNFLLNGVPSDTVVGYITAPKPNTPEVLAGAGGPAVEAPKAKGKAKLAAVPTSASAANSPLAAPVQAASPVNTGQAAVGSASTNLAQANSTPAIVPPPTNIQDAANALKALVQDDARGVAAGYADPGAGRKAAVAILESFGVTQMGQIPPAKLAEFKAQIDAAGKTPVAAAVAGADLL